MAQQGRYRFAPDYAVPPGDTLRESLAAQGMTQAELAQRIGLPVKAVRDVIRGKVPITTETAMQLERALGIPTGIWLSLEANYQATLARAVEDCGLK